MPNITKRNHYNPCQWTAHWNTRYLEGVLARKPDNGTARDQTVTVLNVKSDRIYRTKVQNVHFDQDIGVAKITPDAAKDFCRRHFPDEYKSLCTEIDSNPKEVFLDFEDILTGIERGHAYVTLWDVIARRGISSGTQRAHLAGFILLDHVRGHAIMNAMLELTAELGMHKFQYFWMLKHSLANAWHLYLHVMKYVTGRCRFYRVRQDSFPLNDSPILVKPDSIMVALSPRLLLEIDRTQQQEIGSWELESSIRPETLEEFRRRTINNAFREIIFSDEATLETWRGSPHFRARHEQVSNMTNYRQLVASNGSADLWELRPTCT